MKHHTEPTVKGLSEEMADSLQAIIAVWEGPRERAALAFAHEISKARDILRRYEQSKLNLLPVDSN